MAQHPVWLLTPPRFLNLELLIRAAIERKQSVSALKSLKGLGETTTQNQPDPQGGAISDRDSEEC